MISSEVSSDYQTDERMAQKLRAIPMPDFQGKTVLDLGCDFGFWSFFAASRGAARVVGVDRGREVRGSGWVDCAAVCRERQNPSCTFLTSDLGKQWPTLGVFNVVLCFSLYHHIYQSAGGDHEPIWFWLWRQTTPGGEVLWENPLSTADPVVQANVESRYHADYTPDKILRAASHYFTPKYLGPAVHVPTREVYRFTPKAAETEFFSGAISSGAGGATKAFLYDNGRRITEIEDVLGFRPHPGSLNLRILRDFDWDRGYVSASILDVVDRSAGLDSEWRPRAARFYPVSLQGAQAYAFRFVGESYPANFMELIAGRRLQDGIYKREVVLCRQKPTC